MRLRSKHSHQSSPTDTPWYFRIGCKQLKSSSPHGYLAAKRPMTPLWPKAHRFQTCLMFGLKDRMKMDSCPRAEGVAAEGTEGALRELALKWFTETQAPLILHEGNFPAWFQGFITRKDAEDHLRDKELGCFLIRLSDKAVGYILSYKGRDRCRHFVINQSKTGQFIVTGDTETHDSLTSLVEYYQKSPIEPFGEYLTCSCFQASSDDLYDVIQCDSRRKPGVSVQAVRQMWDQRSQGLSEGEGEGEGRPVVPPKGLSSEEGRPALPPKSNRRPHTSSQAMPPVPRRGPPSKANSLEDQRPPPQDSSRVLYARLEQPRPTEREQPPPRAARPPHGTTAAGNPEDRGPRVPHRTNTNTSVTDSSEQPSVVYTELSLMDCRSRSLPLLDEAAAANCSYRLSAPTATPTPTLTPPHSGPAPRLSPEHHPRRAGHTRSLLDQRDVESRPSSAAAYTYATHARAMPSSHSQSLEKLSGPQLYHLAGRPCDGRGGGGGGGHGMAAEEEWVDDDRAQEEGYATYAEVPAEPIPRRHHLLDNTYEQIPGQKAQAWAEERRTLGNTYESLEDLRNKQTSTASAAKGDKWRWLFPDHRKKQH